MSAASPDAVAGGPGEALVWYVAYGSNLSAARLTCYLRGGRPPGGMRVNPGARDPRPPRAGRPVDLPGTLYFAGRPPQWGGGRAPYDHRTPGVTAARAYLLTAGQLADVAAQEMYRAPTADDPLERVLGTALTGGRHTLGPGPYETVVHVGAADGRPMVTLTAAHGAAEVPHTPPAPAYVVLLAAGLRESRGWDDARIATYLARAQAAPG